MGSSNMGTSSNMCGDAEIAMVQDMIAGVIRCVLGPILLANTKLAMLLSLVTLTDLKWLFERGAEHAAFLVALSPELLYICVASYSFGLQLKAKEPNFHTLIQYTKSGLRGAWQAEKGDRSSNENKAR
eukprot:scaffold13404_cov17-Tisochrysis_lutea.AAC.2